MKINNQVISKPSRRYGRDPLLIFFKGEGKGLPYGRLAMAAIVLCLVFVLLQAGFVFAFPVAQVSFNQQLWEKSDEMANLIATYNEKGNAANDSKTLRIYGSNKKGIRYHTRVNTTSGETQIYIYRGDNLVIKMQGKQASYGGSRSALAYGYTGNSFSMKNLDLSSRAGKIIMSAKRYLGTPYVFGGTSPSGFDCSGFVMTIFKMNGVSVLRCADEQYSEGKYVPTGEMLPGDLVFFETYAPGASHVGIYVGDNKFIHASSRWGVTVSSLNDAYYSSHYIGARRMW